MMKIEYLANGSNECPLIRLYDHEVTDVVALRGACGALAQGLVSEFQLSEQPWVEPLGGCRLILRRVSADRGVLQLRDGAFALEYGATGWLRVDDLLESFVDGTAGHQWLSDDGEIQLLISWSGQW